MFGLFEVRFTRSPASDSGENHLQGSGVEPMDDAGEEPAIILGKLGCPGVRFLEVAIQSAFEEAATSNDQAFVDGERRGWCANLDGDDTAHEHPGTSLDLMIVEVKHNSTYWASGRVVMNSLTGRQERLDEASALM